MKKEPILSVDISKYFPPVLWSLFRNMLGKKSQKPISYQDVFTPSPMTRLHEGTFSKIHEKYALLDYHIGSDTNKTRLRVYTLCTFGSIALSNTKDGDFLTAGISYGTAPLVMAEYLNFASTDRSWYLIDPLDGRGATNYNTNFELVNQAWNSGAKAIWVRELLNLNVIAATGPLAFAHLNTGDFNSEIEVLPLLFERLIKGGFIIIDLYGWQTPEDQRKIDEVLSGIGAASFMWVTRQLIIFRP
jgi:hypothetical protein